MPQGVEGHTNHIEVRIIKELVEESSCLWGAAEAQGLGQPVTFRYMMTLQHVLIGRKGGDVYPVTMDVFQGPDPGVKVLGGHGSGEVAGVTHAHPLGLEGAIMIALATALSYNDAPALEIIERLLGRAESPQAVSRLEKAGEWLRGEDAIDARTVAAELGNGVAAHESCATAVYAALAFRDRPFDELLEFAIGLGGDVDTIAAMACAIWGAGRGEDALPADRLEQLEQRDRIAELARSLSLAAGS